ncbi:precorrin-3B C17-methyltransferase [Methanocaldococcus infernus ME]|uniref:Precorrin-3B C17-methyltransferase n=1 Tax=Methanocaldococcus infernus (strain DSM 11812 / JCM 15783 / ME) TaxID=573063 RepID=D5VR92_METIM|nr:precorrin-3B C17-methyltransferase [Methanocaldococcus infernus ME]
MVKILYIVGIGSGEKFLTKEAEEILNKVDLIVCYSGYKKYVEKYNKPIFTTGMKKEIERVKKALEEAKDKDVALVSTGDPTIYGLASLAYELNKDNIKIEVIPGVTACSIASSLLGAVINHDFVVLSLSDHLTPLNLIIKRFKLALEGDFIICLYNPIGKKRKKPFLEVVELLKDKNLVIGIVKNAGRENEEKKIINSKELVKNLDFYLDYIDMNTILLIGNSKTKIIDGKMVTPRGYLEKYSI